MTDLGKIHDRINILLDQTNARLAKAQVFEDGRWVVRDQVLVAGLEVRAAILRECLACFSPDPPEKAA